MSQRCPSLIQDCLPQGAAQSALSLHAPVLGLQHWHLAPELRHLNHGAFGALSVELAAQQQELRLQIERNPGRFMMDQLYEALAAAVVPLAAFVGTQPERLALVENTSCGIATVLASMDFAPGERVLSTSHGYGAVQNSLRELARRRGILPVNIALPSQIETPDQILSAVTEELAKGARLLIIDHITSPTGLLFPVAELVALARAAGVAVLVDGAHGAGMIALDIDAIGADYYIGSCHKWLCAPRGTGFIVCAPWVTPPLPMVISHAYGAGFPHEFRKIGSRDPSHQLLVPAAIDLHQRLGGEKLRQRNLALASQAGKLLAEACSATPAGPDAMQTAMISLRLNTPKLPPNFETARALSQRLCYHHAIEVLVLAMDASLWLRISAQAYNSLADYDALVLALPAALWALEGEL